jgi:hypothetical protein
MAVWAALGEVEPVSLGRQPDSLKTYVERTRR